MLQDYTIGSIEAHSRRLSSSSAPRKKHATVMARFATFCATKIVSICHDLEVSLGPDTGLLRMRVGLHSGPVTAGVLRGDKGRFQVRAAHFGNFNGW